MSAVRLSSCTENFHIFFEGLRKHFLYVCCQADFQPFSIANLENFSQTNNTQWGYCYEKIVAHPKKKSSALYINSMEFRGLNEFKEFKEVVATPSIKIRRAHTCSYVPVLFLVDKEANAP